MMPKSPSLPQPLSPVERRLLAEYGAIFLTTATPPPKIVFGDEDEVLAFQNSLEITQGVIGEHSIELQSSAMNALKAAVSIAARAGTSITPRSADSARRSYQQTLNLWLRNVEKGLGHWTSLGRLSAGRAAAMRALAPVRQVEVVLEIENSEQIYFSTYFDKSILHSVAAPGASQHLSLLAFDVAEYQEETVEQIMATQGWYRTVLSDLPHFTYLGHKEYDLAELGLRQVVRKYDGRMYHFWIPEMPNPPAPEPV